jgi:Arc/MetJ-type ribon-helix-helix transcriptional regulator
MPRPRLTVRVDSGRIDLLDQVAKQRSYPGNRVTRSDVVREALEDLLRKEGHLMTRRQNGHADQAGRKSAAPSQSVSADTGSAGTGGDAATESEVETPEKYHLRTE